MQHNRNSLEDRFTPLALLIGCILCKLIRIRHTICRRLGLPHRRWRVQGYRQTHIVGE